MKINGKKFHTIWLKENDEQIVQIIDQRFLPHEFVIENLETVDDVERAIREMHVRGAPLIGVAAAFGMYLSALEAIDNQQFTKYINESAEKLKAARPTAVNLAWAVDQQLELVSENYKILPSILLENAERIKKESIDRCKKIGEFGLPLIEDIYQRTEQIVNILTHCNAGWMACIDYGTATAPIYAAHDKGIPVHVWVDETRPRNQGARITAFELQEHGVPHTVITDNAGGHLMQHGEVDMVLVGTDRTARNGDVCNKIGTYLKALAAKDNNIPFYVGAPTSSIDFSLKNGFEIPIEERGEEEVKYIQGMCDGEIKKILLTPKASPAANFAFDVTPARLVTGLITEFGICKASQEELLRLYQ
ncbi:S-methyl-5-thioribose-1-phosphate isomerase [bacterium]|nr:S-methyl-5-thioribose-1-phosphate isomerase [bacterium]MDG1435201.1 S-methyl-5-thioribose-1-phosphate isomerase [Saprospiraceae bacterium]